MNYKRRSKFTTTLAPFARERLQQIADAFHRDCNEILEDMIDEFYRKSFKKRLAKYQDSQKLLMASIKSDET
jgi:hypothetical protein